MGHRGLLISELFGEDGGHAIPKRMDIDLDREVDYPEPGRTCSACGITYSRQDLSYGNLCPLCRDS